MDTKLNLKRDIPTVIVGALLVVVLMHTFGLDQEETVPPAPIPDNLIISKYDPTLQFLEARYKDLTQNTILKDLSFTQRDVTSEFWVTSSAYTSRVQETDNSPFITASGTRVHWGTVASNFLPFETRLRIPDLFGNKVFVVEDRMNRRYYHMLDIWYPDLEDALEFGNRRIRVQILSSK